MADPVLQQLTARHDVLVERRAQYVQAKTCSASGIEDTSSASTSVAPASTSTSASSASTSVAPTFVPQSSAARSTEIVLGKRRAPLTETQLETKYGDFAMKLMRKWGAFDDGTFEDPKCHLVKEAKQPIICTDDERATMPRKKKRKQEEANPGKWDCHKCGVSYDGGEGWEKSRKYWYCPNCTKKQKKM